MFIVAHLNSDLNQKLGAEQIYYSLTETQLKELPVGIYQYTNSQTVPHMPSQYGILVVMPSQSTYKAYEFYDTFHHNYYRLLNTSNGEWYSSWLQNAHFIVGTSTGNTGNSTIDFIENGYRQSYFVKCGNMFGTITVLDATNATLVKCQISNNTPQLSTENLIGSNWKFTVTGLPWYDTLVAI